MVPLIVTGLIGLGIGVWLGLPGRYSQGADDIDRIMEGGGARRRKTKRVFTPLAWMQRRSYEKVTKQRRRGTGKSGFSLENPEKREREREEERERERGRTTR